jgi:MscS family membrane protein
MVGARFFPVARLVVLAAFAATWQMAQTSGLYAQSLPGAAPAQQAPAGQPAPPRDPLGRTTPRGTVLGFLHAGHRGDDELAREYLNTRLTGEAAQNLAHQLFVVLDARLPARLSQLSDDPEGSGSNPLTPDRDLVGTVSGAGGSVEIVVERIRRGQEPPVWLFSSRTLESVPALFEEISSSQDSTLVRILTTKRIGGVRLFEWLSVLLGVLAFYLATVLLNRILTPLLNRVWARIFSRTQETPRDVLPMPARLLLLALTGRLVLENLSLSLFVRQFWSSAASLLTIVACAWLLILLNGVIERVVSRRVSTTHGAGAKSLLRLMRRGADALVIFLALLAMLQLFAIDATPALAGLGVGGIAVALAAQKTLENVIAGASLIFDEAVRVGDFLKMGDVVGTVDHIGLRSTRIRTNDRTVISVPNSQIANATLETISARDKFWFHPIVGLQYETTTQQLQTVVDSIRRLLNEHPLIDAESVRVRFIRLGAFSLDIEAFAYLYARDWNHFLELQERLLFSVTEIVSRAGTAIAFPSQTMYVKGEGEGDFRLKAPAASA